MPPLSLYTFRDLMLPDLGTIPLLYPVFGFVPKDTTPYVNAVYRQHMADGSQYRLVDQIADADYAVIPHPYLRLLAKAPELAKQMFRLAQEADKPVLIDVSGDIEIPLDIPNAVVLRMGQYRFLRRSNEITVPIDVEDLGETYFDGSPPLRAKSQVATLGFSGWAHLTFTQRLKAELKFFPTRARSFFDSRYGALEKGVVIRERALRALSRSKRIVPNFIARQSYSGNTRTLAGDVRQNRDAFVRNLVDSDYALSIRGDGNVDMRLYEAMSLGKIPVIVNTERVLPVEDRIDYRSFCLFVDFRDLKDLDRRLAEFHANLSPEVFEAMQKRAREAFVTYLRPDAFTKYMMEDLRQRLKSDMP